MKTSDNSTLNIVLIEDEPLIRGQIIELLKPHRIQTFISVAQLMNTEFVPFADLILIDLCHPKDPKGEHSIKNISALKNRFHNSTLVIQSGVSEVASMRACIQQGASQFFLKEHLPSEIPCLIEKLQATKGLRKSIDKLLIGNSSLMKNLKDEIMTLRLGQAQNVLIEGETGSGKELCAQALCSEHEKILAVNMSAIAPELFEAEFFGAEKGAFSGSHQTRIGHFEATANGVLFMDEVQSLAAPHQPKLLRVLESRTFSRVGSSTERPFQGRVISASNQGLREMALSERFREDLYYRLANQVLLLPPLRLRLEDLPLLVEHFMLQHQMQNKSFSDEAIQALQDYDWPGNVRELRNVVFRLLSSSRIPVIDKIAVQDCLLTHENQIQQNIVTQPETTQAQTGFTPQWDDGFDKNIEYFEKFLLEQTLRKASTSEARNKLKLPRTRFYEKLNRYNLLNRPANQEADPS